MDWFANLKYALHQHERAVAILLLLLLLAAFLAAFYSGMRWLHAREASRIEALVKILASHKLRLEHLSWQPLLMPQRIFHGALVAYLRLFRCVLAPAPFEQIGYLEYTSGSGKYARARTAIVITTPVWIPEFDLETRRAWLF